MLYAAVMSSTGCTAGIRGGIGGRPHEDVPAGALVASPEPGEVRKLDVAVPRSTLVPLPLYVMVTLVWVLLRVKY